MRIQGEETSSCLNSHWLCFTVTPTKNRCVSESWERLSNRLRDATSNCSHRADELLRGNIGPLQICHTTESGIATSSSSTTSGCCSVASFVLPKNKATAAMNRNCRFCFTICISGWLVCLTQGRLKDVVEAALLRCLVGHNLLCYQNLNPLATCQYAGIVLTRHCRETDTSAIAVIGMVVESEATALCMEIPIVTRLSNSTNIVALADGTNRLRNIV